MNLNRLKRLKIKLTTEKDFSDIWLFYMDHFADKPEFTEVGHPAENEQLQAILRQTCEYMLGRKIKVHDLLLIHIPEYQFFHGPFHIDSGIGGMIYYEDIQTGMLALTEFPPCDIVKYSRFSAASRVLIKDPYEHN